MYSLIILLFLKQEEQQDSIWPRLTLNLFARFKVFGEEVYSRLREEADRTSVKLIA